MEKQASPRAIPNAKSVRIRKWLRRLKYFVVALIFVVICQVAIGYWLLSSRWELYVPEEKMIRFAIEVSLSDPAPDNFRKVYTAIFPHHVNATMSQQIFFNYGVRIIFKDKDIESKPHCFCDLVYDLQKARNKELGAIEWNGRIQDMEYGFGMERYTTPDKCFDYVIGERIKDLKVSLEPEKFPLITKQIENLNEDEIIELILLIQHKTKFNRYKNEQAYNRAFRHYKDRLMNAQDN
jgi:hypothetical protein